MLPNANAILAIFIVNNTKIRVLNDFTYLVMLKRIAMFINKINVEIIVTLDINSISLASKIKKDIKIKIGKMGCSPEKPELNLSKFSKSIPKTNLCKKKPNILLSL